MKRLILLFVLSHVVANLVLAAGLEKKSPKKSTSVVKTKTGDKAATILKEKEDCDEKAKKAKEVEIKPESLSLGGNTGCTLE
jgi:hypothetical protein